MDKPEKERLVELLHKEAMIAREDRDPLPMPYKRQKVYELNNETFYSLNAASSFCSISEPTLRRRVKKNEVYHVLLNNKVKFIKWQALVNGAIENGWDRISVDRVNYTLTDSDTFFLRTWSEFTDSSERDAFVQKQLDRKISVLIEPLERNVREIIQENTCSGKRKEHVTPKGLTHEYIVSKFCWAKFELAANEISFNEYENQSSKFYKSISYEKFKRIKDSLLKNREGWTIKDLRKLIESD